MAACQAKRWRAGIASALRKWSRRSRWRRISESVFRSSMVSTARCSRCGWPSVWGLIRRRRRRRTTRACCSTSAAPPTRTSTPSSSAMSLHSRRTPRRRGLHPLHRGPALCAGCGTSRHCGRWRIGWPRTHSRAPRDGHNPYRRPDGTNRLRPPVTEQSSTGDLSSTRHFRTEPGGLPRQAARGREAQRDVADIMTVSDRLALFNRRVTNPIVRLFAGRRWSPVAVVVHRGRRSGRRYRTPVIAFGTDDGYLISLPYGTERDWVSNVVATGSCTLERTGRRIELTSPKVLAQHQAMPLLPWPVRTGLRLLRIRSVLQLSAR